MTADTTLGRLEDVTGPQTVNASWTPGRPFGETARALVVAIISHDHHHGTAIETQEVPGPKFDVQQLDKRWGQVQARAREMASEEEAAQWLRFLILMELFLNLRFVKGQPVVALCSALREIFKSDILPELPGLRLDGEHAAVLEYHWDQWPQLPSDRQLPKL